MKKNIVQEKRVLLAALCVSLMVNVGLIGRLGYLSWEAQKEQPGLYVSYEEDTDRLLVRALRPEPDYDAFTLEDRSDCLGEVLSLAETYSEDGADYFLFDILKPGRPVLLFYTFPPDAAEEERLKDPYQCAYISEWNIAGDVIGTGERVFARWKNGYRVPGG